jgi:hypothetical protein
MCDSVKNTMCDETTSDDTLEQELDLRRSNSLANHYRRRMEKLEQIIEDDKPLMLALSQFKASLAAHAGAKNAWDNFVVILMLVDPAAKHYIDKLK